MREDFCWKHRMSVINDLPGRQAVLLAGKQVKFREKACGESACGRFSCRSQYPQPCDTGNKRVSQQESASGSEQLRDAARPGGARSGMDPNTFREIKSESRKAAPAAQRQACNEKDSEILEG